MQLLKLRITESDILTTKKFKISNPILFVLQCTTGTLWRIEGDGILKEAIAPFRFCALTADALQAWREYSLTGRMQPCEIEMIMCDNESGVRAFAGNYALDSLQEHGKPGC